MPLAVKLPKAEVGHTARDIRNMPISEMLRYPESGGQSHVSRSISAIA
jgi:hypothetical protein